MVLKLLKCTKLNQLEAEIFRIGLLTKEKVCKSRLLLCEKLSQKMQICQKSSADRFFFPLAIYYSEEGFRQDVCELHSPLLATVASQQNSAPNPAYIPLPNWRFCVPLQAYARSRQWPLQNKNLHCFSHPDFHLCIPTAFPLASNCAH